MGGHLVSRAFALGERARLSPPAFRALAYMALRALDDDKNPRFFGGREDLAFGMGYRLPDEPAASDDSDDARAARTLRASAFTQGRKALAELKAEGFVSQTNLQKGRVGRQPEYSIRLAPVDITCGQPREEYRASTARSTERVQRGVPSEYSARTERVHGVYRGGTPHEPSGANEERSSGGDPVELSPHQAATR